ncbi:LysR family transcriptional regulator [Rhodobacteraceae bacterium W635]|uniref:LysR family transcriptional regulator n=1 Tax=Nioella halotolerans TaxID=2303578 RepID=UPI000E3B750C|nr:LysR family transcriptional regulator [Rhodobacteraceae bacterium W635]
MDWRDIPSLSALRAFEAAARLQSFSAAARELNVTHAAIAQHVRALEAHFAVTLVEREGRAMRPTAEGRQLAQDLEDGFGTIAAGVRSVMNSKRQRPLQVTMTPSFAEAWLMPRIGQFWAQHPEVEVALIPSVSLIDLRREGFDMAIRFGAGDWPGLEVEPLVMSPFVVIAAPSLAKGRRLTEMGPLDGYRWFTSEASREHFVWGRAAGLDLERLGFTELPNNSLAQAAVRAGHGLSIQAQTLVKSDLAEERLVALHTGESGGLGYHMVTQKGVRPAPLAAFMTWLRRAAKE